MAESRVNRNNYITIQGFMLTDLKLKGNELIIYACIYGFCQAENQTFSGSLQYLADWTNSTKQGVIKSLKSLVEKGFIEKNDKIINGVKFCEYRITELNRVLNKVEYPMQQSLTGGIQQSSHNNIDLENIEDTNNNNKAKKSPFDEIINDYANGNEEIAELLFDWVKVRKAKRSAVTKRAIEMNLERLDKLATQSKMTVPEYLKEVICRGWAAFYPIGNYNSNARAVGENGIALSSEKSALDTVF